MHKRLMAMKQNLASAIEAQLCNIGEVDCEELGCAIDMLKDLEEALYFCTITEAMNGEGKGKGSVEIEYEGHKKNGHSQMNGNDQMYYPMYANGGSSQMNMGGMPMMYANGGSGSSGNSGGGSSSGGSGSSGGSSSGGGGSSYYGGLGGYWDNQPYYNGTEWVCYGGNEPMYYQSRDSRGRFTSGRGGGGGNSRNDYSEPMMMERDEREGRSPMNRKMYMEAKDTKDKASQLRELEKYMQELTSDMVEMIQDSSPEEKQYLEKKISALASKIGQMK